MTAITPIPTSPEAKGTAQVDSTQSSTALLASSTSGVNNFVDAQSKIVTPPAKEYLIPGNPPQTAGKEMKNKYIVLANKKVFTINASGALSALKKVCSTIQLKSGKIKVQKVNPKRNTMIHEYKVRTLKNGKLDIIKLL
jgi:hypothetical protein